MITEEYKYKTKKWNNALMRTFISFFDNYADIYKLTRKISWNNQIVIEGLACTFFSHDGTYPNES